MYILFPLTFAQAANKQANYVRTCIAHIAHTLTGAFQVPLCVCSDLSAYWIHTSRLISDVEGLSACIPLWDSSCGGPPIRSYFSFHRAFTAASRYIYRYSICHTSLVSSAVASPNADRMISARAQLIAYAGPLSSPRRRFLAS
jgi:hypothetical protein